MTCPRRKGMRVAHGREEARVVVRSVRVGLILEELLLEGGRVEVLLLVVHLLSEVCWKGLLGRLTWGKGRDRGRRRFRCTDKMESESKTQNG